jgi:hypothetical protein
MNSMPINSPRNVQTATCLLIMGLLAQTASRCLAVHPLDCVPPTATSVLVFRNLEETSKNVNEYLTRFFPEAHPIVPRDIEISFDLPESTIDFGLPVMLLSTQAGFEGESLVVGFSAKQGSSLLPKPDHPEGIVRTCKGAEGEHFVVTRRGLVFVAGNRRPLRLLKPGSFRKSLSEALDPNQKKLLDTSDVFVRLSMDRWRDRVNPWLTLLSTAINTNLAQNAGDQAAKGESSAFVSWFSDGARAVLDQMRTLSVGLQFDGKTLRVAHFHSFMPGESTAQYLNQIQRNKIDFTKLIPDRRFMMLVTCDWQTTGENSLSYRLSKMAMGLDSVAHRFDPEKREKLLEVSKDCHDQMLGTYFVMGSPGKKPQFVQLLGGNIMQDAERGLAHMKYFQENAADLISVFMPGTAYANKKFTQRKCATGGKKYLEIAFASKDADNQSIKDLETIYGPRPLFQMAVASPSNLVYSVVSSENSVGVCDYLGRAPGEKTLADNARIAAMIKKMPADRNVVCLLDVDALFDTLPIFVRAALQKQGMHNPENRIRLVSTVTPSSENGPLIGWSASVHKNSLSGEFIVEADQIPLIVSSARRVAVDLSRSVAPAIHPPLPPKAPRAP